MIDVETTWFPFVFLAVGAVVAGFIWASVERGRIERARRERIRSGWGLDTPGEVGDPRVARLGDPDEVVIEYHFDDLRGRSHIVGSREAVEMVVKYEGWAVTDRRYGDGSIGMIGGVPIYEDRCPCEDPPAPTKCLYCDGTDPDCGFCELGDPLDTQADWDASWGSLWRRHGGS